MQPSLKLNVFAWRFASEKYNAGAGAAAICKAADDFSTAAGIPGLLPAGACWFRVAQRGRDSVVPGWLALRHLNVKFEVQILPEDGHDTITSVVRIAGLACEPTPARVMPFSRAQGGLEPQPETESS